MTHHIRAASLVLVTLLSIAACDEEGTVTDFDRDTAVVRAGPAAVLPGASSVYTDTFDDGVNAGGWVIGGPSGDQILAGGGNPGAYLRDANLFSPAPSMATTGASAFTGNYAATGVRALGVDLVLYEWPFAPASAQIHLIIWNDNGTPTALDDKAVWVSTGVDLPADDGEWVEYETKVPSGFAALPKGWTAYDSGTIVTDDAADAVWNVVMRDVDRVGWSWGAPLSANIFSNNDSGMDNATIVRMTKKK